MKNESYEHYKEKFPFLFKVEELKKDPKTGGVLGRCKNSKCKNSKEQGGWFLLENAHMYYRNWGLNKGWDTYCFYCCENCKQECPAYGKTASALIKEYGLIINNDTEDNEWSGTPYTQEERDVWRKAVLDRENGLCQYCEDVAKHIHHEKPVKTHPHLALDVDNGIATCVKCHYKYGHKTNTECSTGELAKKKCSTIKKEIK